MTKKRGLGSKRGLEALMGSIKKEKQLTQSVSLPKTQTQLTSAKNQAEQLTVAVKTDPVTDLQKVALRQINPNSLQPGKYQPRKDINPEALDELAQSIRQHGIMQPIVIRPLLNNEDKTHKDITHEIIAGERRWRAAQIAGLDSIPAIERMLSDEVAIALALIENIQREDLNVLEQAAALQRFHTEFGMSHAMIADVVGKARTTVSNLLRLNQLNDDVKNMMTQGHLDMGHARTLLSLPQKQQPIIAKKIIEQKMTVRDAEKLVKSILNPQAKPEKTDDHEMMAFNQKLCDALGKNIKLKQNKDGKGSIEIFFYDHDELKEILATFGVTI